MILASVCLPHAAAWKCQKAPPPSPDSDGKVTYLVLVDEVRESEEHCPSGHDEGANHRVHETDHQHQKESRVHLRIVKPAIKRCRPAERDGTSVSQSCEQHLLIVV